MRVTPASRHFFFKQKERRSRELALALGGTSRSLIKADYYVSTGTFHLMCSLHLKGMYSRSFMEVESLWLCLGWFTSLISLADVGGCCSSFGFHANAMVVCLFYCGVCPRDHVIGCFYDKLSYQTKQNTRIAN